MPLQIHAYPLLKIAFHALLCLLKYGRAIILKMCVPAAPRFDGCRQLGDYAISTRLRGIFARGIVGVYPEMLNRSHN